MRFLYISFVSLCSIVIASPTPPGAGWKTLAKIAGGPRQEHSVAAIGDDVYVVAGVEPSGPAPNITTTNRVEVYNTKSDEWSDIPELPITLNHPNVAAVDGKLYVLGGLSGSLPLWEAVPNCYVFEPRRKLWRQLPAMPPGTVRGSAATAVYGSKIYLAGGMRSLMVLPGGFQDSVDVVTVFDTKTNEWASLPPLPEPRDHAGVAIVGSHMYVLGGRRNGQFNVSGKVFALDLKSPRQWQSKAEMPTARGGIASAAVGNLIYTFGGEGNPSTETNVFEETEAYDVKADKWHKLDPMEVPRHGTAAVAVGRVVYIPGGGIRAGGSPVDVNTAFSPGRLA